MDNRCREINFHEVEFVYFVMGVFSFFVIDCPLLSGRETNEKDLDAIEKNRLDALENAGDTEVNAWHKCTHPTPVLTHPGPTPPACCSPACR